MAKHDNDVLKGFTHDLAEMDAAFNLGLQMEASFPLGVGLENFGFSLVIKDQWWKVRLFWQLRRI